MLLSIISVVGLLGLFRCIDLFFFEKLVILSVFLCVIFFFLVFSLGSWKDMGRLNLMVIFLLFCLLGIYVICFCISWVIWCIFLFNIGVMECIMLYFWILLVGVMISLMIIMFLVLAVWVLVGYLMFW